MAKHNLKPMKEIMAELSAKGFNKNFRIEGNRLISNETRKTYASDEVQLVDFYRFEGDSNPGDSSILYALETASGEKGTLINNYGAGANLETDEFLQRIEGRMNY